MYIRFWHRPDIEFPLAVPAVVAAVLPTYWIISTMRRARSRSPGDVETRLFEHLGDCHGCPHGSSRRPTSLLAGLEGLQRGFCCFCGYYLWATPSRCPECGTVSHSKKECNDPSHEDREHWTGMGNNMTNATEAQNV